MNLAVRLDHAQNLVCIEYADMVYRIDKTVGAGGAVPSEFSKGTARGRGVDQRAYPQTVTVTNLSARAGEIREFCLIQPVAAHGGNRFRLEDALPRATDSAVCERFDNFAVFVDGGADSCRRFRNSW